jgi:hypothetical protein
MYVGTHCSNSYYGARDSSAESPNIMQAIQDLNLVVMNILS